MAALARLLKHKELADERWAQEVLTVALADARIFFDAKGNLLPMSQWTAEHGALLASSETIVKNAEGGDGHTDRILKIKHWDKLRALEIWGKYRSLLVERSDNTLHADINLILDEGLARVAAAKAARTSQ